MATPTEDPNTISSSPAPPDVRTLLESLKTTGIESALIRADGGLVFSTFHLDDAGAAALAGTSNVAGTLLQRGGDAQRELEIVMENDLIVLLPLKSHFLCGVLKNREQKKTLREYADRLGKMI